MAIGRTKRYGVIIDPVRGCLGKTKWNSEESAQRAISRIRRDNPGSLDSTVRPYRCAFCRKWHVGHEL